MRYQGRVVVCLLNFDLHVSCVPDSEVASGPVAACHDDAMRLNARAGMLRLAADYEVMARRADKRRNGGSASHSPPS